MKRLLLLTALIMVTCSLFAQRYSRKVYVRPSPMVVVRQPVYVRRPPMVVSRPPVFAHPAPVIVSRPPVYYPYHNVSFRFYGGSFYRPYGSYWRVTPPPIGLHISFLPFGCMPMYVGPSMYYYGNGSYYRRTDDRNYEVVDPPMGATLSELPKGAKSSLVNGEQFYELNGTYYKKTTNEKGKTVYVVTGKNGTINNSPEAAPGTFVPQQGDIIDQLPENCRTVQISNTTYYVSPDEIYYQPVDQDGVTRYQVVSKPTNDIKG